MKITILCTVALALLQLGLGLTISALRRRYRKSVGCEENLEHPLFKVRTAFGNCAEWHPLLMILMLVQAMQFMYGYAPAWTVWIAPLVVAGRFTLVTGLLTFPLDRPNLFRVTGAGLTYLCGLVYCGVIVYSHWFRQA